MMSAYNRMTVAALREECASRGLLCESLNKRGIIALLRQSDDADDSDRYMLPAENGLQNQDGDGEGNVDIELGGDLQEEEPEAQGWPRFRAGRFRANSVEQSSHVSRDLYRVP